MDKGQKVAVSGGKKRGQKPIGTHRDGGIAYGYARVSTGRQAEEGQSLSAQSERISFYAGMERLELRETFVDGGVSGGTPLVNRPNGKKLSEVLRGGDTVIITRLDRAFRDAFDALATIRLWDEIGVTLHVIELGGNTSGPFGKFMIQVIAAVAEMERWKITERIKDVREDMRRRGRYLGGHAPFGAVVTGGTLDTSRCGELEAMVIQFADGGHSCRSIADEMARAGFPVGKSTVQRIIAARKAAA